MNESITAELFAFLDVVVLEQLDNNLFRVIGIAPDWFAYFSSDLASQQEGLTLGKKFSFLENFLIDAEYFWKENQPGPLKSGLWVETNALGEHYLEASAIKLKNKRLLLISLLKSDYTEKQSLIQQGRESSLIHYRLVKEIQKKETLLHCLAHDILGELAAVNYCFQLLELQNLTPKGREYVQVGRKQTIKQEMLVQEISKAFSIDMSIDATQTSDLLICTVEVVKALLPTFVLNNKQLLLKPGIDFAKDWKVIGENLGLERVISNLVENAFRHSPPESIVTISLEEDGLFIRLTVNDEGTGVPEDTAKNLFNKFFQGKEKYGRAGLGLYYCRVTVERWGGTIGYIPLQKGSQFWFRLPKPALQVK